MKLTASFFAAALALTTFACASQTEDGKSADSDLSLAPPVRHCGYGITGIET